MGAVELCALLKWPISFQLRSSVSRKGELPLPGYTKRYLLQGEIETFPPCSLKVPLEMQIRCLQMGGIPGAGADGSAGSCPVNRDSWANIAIMQYLVRAAFPRGLLSGDNCISFRGPIVFGNILIGRALFFTFVQSVIKFPTGPLFFLLSSQEFHHFRKMFPWVQQVNKQTLPLVTPPWA